MGHRSLFGSSAAIVAVVTLAACSSPLPTGVGEIPAPRAVNTVLGGSASDAPDEAGTRPAGQRSGGSPLPAPSEPLLVDGTGWLGGGG